MSKLLKEQFEIRRKKFESRIAYFEEKKMYAEVKFVDFIENAKTFILGIKFVELNSDQTTLMRNTLLQIDRILRQKSQD